jgi:tyrosyl-tRNA synthetase
MATTTPTQEDILLSGLAESINRNVLRTALSSDNKVAYLGTAPTGKPHIAYIPLFLKIAELVDAGFKVKILLADIHATLDSRKSEEDIVGLRCEYYEVIFRGILATLAVPEESIEFVRGSEFQRSEKYVMNMLHISTKVTAGQACRAADAVVKMNVKDDNNYKDVLLSSMLYSVMQSLDPEYLGASVFLGGIDQKKICVFAETHVLPKLGYASRCYLLLPMIPSFSNVSEKMSSTSSSAKTKITFDDSAAVITKKVNQSFCREGEVDSCGLLAFVKLALIPLLQRLRQSPFSVTTKSNDVFVFEDPEELETAFSKGFVHPKDLKAAVCAVLVPFLESVQLAASQFCNACTLAEIAQGAYQIRK